MLDDPEDMLGACLKKLGILVQRDRPRGTERAEREAIAQKPLLRAYLNAEVRDQLVAGDVLVAQLWSTTAPRQSTPLRTWHSSIPRRVSRSIATAP